MLKRSTKVILDRLKTNDWDIHILLVGDKRIRHYNQRYLKHDCVTDVISFPIQESGVLGDVLISVPQANRQAREQGHSLKKELMILIIHGVLHILGYDHQRKSDAKKMWRKTNSLLKLVS